MITITTNAPTTPTSVKGLFQAANSLWNFEVGGKRHIVISTATNTGDAVIVFGGVDHTGNAAINASATPVEGHPLVGDGVKPAIVVLPDNPELLFLHADTVGQPITVSLFSTK